MKNIHCFNIIMYDLMSNEIPFLVSVIYIVKY